MSKTISELTGIRPKKGLYGVELEAEFNQGMPEDFHVPGWRVTRDGSLRGEGYEFVMPNPEDESGTKKSFSNLVSDPYFEHDRKSARAGLHVHRNVLHWSKDRLLRFLLAYYLVEEVMIRFCHPDRVGNLFCLRMSDAEEVLEAIRYIVDDEYHHLRDVFGNYKYGALNTASVARLGTVEFRAMHGTTDPREFNAWLDMITSISEFSKRERSLEEVYGMFTRDRVEFCKLVLGTKAPVLKRRDLYDLLDINYSNAYNIISLVLNKDERKRKMKPRRVTYSFPSSEREVDLGNEVFSYV